MSLEEFKNWAVSQGSVAKFTDGNYIGECVSLVNQYLGRVYGIRAGAWGHAKDWATSASVAQHFDKVSSPQAGDIGVGPGTIINPYGHIWIYLDPVTALEQNGRVARRVSINAPIQKPIAILRRKGTPQGDNMANPTMTTLRIAHSEIGGWDLQKSHNGSLDALFQGAAGNKEVNQFIYEQWQAGTPYREVKQRQADFYNKYNKLVGELEARPTKAQLEEVATKLAVESAKVAKAEEALKAEQAKKSEDTVLLDEAGSWFTKLFNRLFKRS